ncbi:hypothetical protein [Thermomonas flagellata]|uniref:hypothetical protein n=1 Tax=Thermomonas flagellata TaxID=2888524 RepID=UPI001F045979|nr:hypothetical protein [Thermomonas flagellata]
MTAPLNLSIRLGVDAKAGLEAFAGLKRTLAQNETALKTAREEAARLAAQLKDVGGTDAGLKAQFDAARSRAAMLKREVSEGRERVDDLPPIAVPLITGRVRG